MKNCCVVFYDEDEKLLFYNYLKTNGYKLSNGEDVSESFDKGCPFGVYLDSKVVVVANNYFLNKFISSGGEILNFEMFKQLSKLKTQKILKISEKAC